MLVNPVLLFLEELPEFGDSVPEGLRQPLEDKGVTIGLARDELAVTDAYEQALLTVKELRSMMAESTRRAHRVLNVEREAVGSCPAA